MSLFEALNGLSATDWLRTFPLQQIIRSFTCPLCARLLKDAHAFSSCGHAFCRQCVLDTLEGPGITASECPVCHQPCWKKDLRPDHQSQTIADLCQQWLNAGEPVPVQPEPAQPNASSRGKKRTASGSTAKPTPPSSNEGSRQSDTGPAAQLPVAASRAETHVPRSEQPTAARTRSQQAAPHSEPSKPAGPLARHQHSLHRQQMIRRPQQSKHHL
ncbi:hypothetical protein WJX73_000417 [Symbiochloris irregularis]|uniref:RING-type domain-containing protein n=1 Tax=Symbiochloris irregularis TaxID=706552 RepID=A0AAW1PM82_9CHLO